MKLFRFFFASLIICLTSILYIFAQSHTRTIKSLERTSEPLEITKIKTSGQEVRFDQPFTAEGEDWFRDLSVTVKNNSHQSVYYIDVQLIFDGNDKDSIATLEHLFYGCDIFPSQSTLSKCRTAPLKPGESTTLVLPNYEDTRNYLTRTGKLQNTDGFAMRIGSLFFADETMWANGLVYVRDPNIPDRWIPKKEPGR